VTQSNANRTGKARILVVDDERPATEMLERFLAMRGYAVMTAYDGDEAIALFRQHGAEAVITDFRMPRKDGRSLIDELRKVSPDLPFIVVSGSLNVADLTAELALLGIEVLAKPIDLRTLPTKIENLLLSTCSHDPGKES
jgi:DNA-binding response OmpR family regulator